MQDLSNLSGILCQRQKRKHVLGCYRKIVKNVNHVGSLKLNGSLSLFADTVQNNIVSHLFYQITLQSPSLSIKLNRCCTYRVSLVFGHHLAQSHEDAGWQGPRSDLMLYYQAFRVSGSQVDSSEYSWSHPTAEWHCLTESCFFFCLFVSAASFGEAALLLRLLLLLCLMPPELHLI